MVTGNTGRMPVILGFQVRTDQADDACMQLSLAGNNLVDLRLGQADWRRSSSMLRPLNWQ